MWNQHLLAVLALLSLIASGSSTQEAENTSYPVLSGVGLALSAKDGHIYAGVVVPKSPAEKSGLLLPGEVLSPRWALA
jgi:hypothetical protein